MKLPEKPHPPVKEPPSKLTRAEEAMRIIEEYVRDLRAIINKLRGRMN
jgi:hypothetical protein